MLWPLLVLSLKTHHYQALLGGLHTHRSQARLHAAAPSNPTHQPKVTSQLMVELSEATCKGRIYDLWPDSIQDERGPLLYFRIKVSGSLKWRIRPPQMWNSSDGHGTAQWSPEGGGMMTLRWPVWLCSSLIWFQLSGNLYSTSSLPPHA